MPKRNMHSRWECPECDFKYESPITATKAVSHPHNKRKRVQLRKVWSSSYDKIKE